MPAPGSRRAGPIARGAALLAALFALGPLAACGAGPADSEGPPRAMVAPDRSGHLLDRPFPSDELRTPAGTVDLQGFPVRGWPVARGFLRAWKGQVRREARGFSALGAVYLRFRGDLRVEPRYASAPTDPVQLVSLDSDHRVPLRTRFVRDSRGDPYLPDGTLMLIPEEREPLRSGERYVAFVKRELAEPAPGWLPPKELLADVAVATVFTVQDHAGELRALGAAVDAALDARPDLLRPRGGLRPVAALAYVPGTTTAGERASLEQRVTYADGSRRTLALAPREVPPQRLDLRQGPMAVFEAEIRVPRLQPPAGQPFQSPGLWDRLLRDPGREDGAIPIRPGPRIPVPEATEPLRLVVQVPREQTLRAALLWMHGSGGDAYTAVSRHRAAEDLAAVRAALAARGVAVVSADMAPFGARFPLIEEGFGTDQGMVNPANLPAMRDTPRQAAAEQRALVRFAGRVLPRLLEREGRERTSSVPSAGGRGAGDEARRGGGAARPGTPPGPGAPTLPVGVFGHSTGAQVAALAGVLHGLQGGRAAPRALLLSGGGGFLSHYPLAANVIEVELPGVGRVSGRRVLGTLFGVPAAARERLDRHHPLLLPYQLVVDGADPLAVAPHQPIPVGVFTGTGDRQVPADSARWLAAASPAGFEVPCRRRGDYDGHYCAFREDAGLRALVELAAYVTGDGVLPVSGADAGRDAAHSVGDAGSAGSAGSGGSGGSAGSGGNGGR